MKVIADAVALGDAERRPGPLRVVAERGDRLLQLVDLVLDLVDREVEDPDLAIQRRRDRLRQVVEEELRDLDERGLLRELRVVVGRAQDLRELREGRRAVDVLEGRRQVADVAADDVARLDVVLGPTGGDRADGRAVAETGADAAGDSVPWLMPGMPIIVGAADGAAVGGAVEGVGRIAPGGCVPTG